jgi:hypothetical protein
MGHLDLALAAMIAHRFCPREAAIFAPDHESRANSGN